MKRLGFKRLNFKKTTKDSYDGNTTWVFEKSELMGEFKFVDGELKPVITHVRNFLDEYPHLCKEKK